MLKQNDDRIAIVGIGCRFPGSANSAEAFWRLLENGVDAITEIPKDRWSAKTFYHSHRSFKGKTVSKWGGFIDDIDKFDAAFFGITNREAPYIDPQQRLLLETTWEAFEDGGLVVEKYSGTDVGVFIGGFTLDYKILQFGSDNYDEIGIHAAAGSMMTNLSNRLSYVFDFKGSSISIDTACSSSLVALHYACESIRAGDCSMAVAGGVMLNLAPQYTIAESQGGFLSTTGRCKTLDSSADGYVRGEGVGIIVLKKLEDAIRDNDHIYSIVKATGVNQDGRSSAITVPNGKAQESLMRKVHQRAGIDSKDIQYFEMHGTGTPIGDPIEAEAIGNVISAGRHVTNPCLVGSIKTMIGHTESAAGVASIIKTSLALSKKRIPRHLHLKSLNPQIDLLQYCLKVPNDTTVWPEHAGVAIACVNGFGFGGTNAHVVLTGAPVMPKIDNKHLENKMKIFPISARSKESLSMQVKKYLHFINENNLEGCSYDLAHSMMLRRDQHPYRLAVAVKNITELRNSLEDFLSEESSSLVFESDQKKAKGKGLVFVFTGMGVQWWKMGRGLYATEAIFREVIDRIDKAFYLLSGWSLVEKMIHPEEEDSEMSETRYSQPANFAIQVALYNLLESFGIQPEVIVGHSVGELAAFYCAGVLSFEDTLKVVYYRSELQHELSGTGKMLAANITKQQANDLLTSYPSVEIVAINSQNDLTLTGDEHELFVISEQLKSAGVFSRFLTVDVPFHSRHMDKIEDKFKKGVVDISFQKPNIRIFSTVQGAELVGEDAVQYCWKNVRNSVLFLSSIEKIIEEGFHSFVEIGPHPALSHYLKSIASQLEKEVVTAPTLSKKQEDEVSFYSTLCQLYVENHFTQFHNLYKEPGNFIKLPSYAWKHESYWSEPEEGRRHRLGIIDAKMLGRRLSAAKPTWELELNTQMYPLLEGHKIQGNLVFPAAGYIEAAHQAAKCYLNTEFIILEAVEFLSVVFLKQDRSIRLHTILDEEELSFELYKMPDGVGRGELVAKGRYRLAQNTGAGMRQDRVKEQELQEEEHVLIFDEEQIYENFEVRGYSYSGAFRCLEKLWVGKDGLAANVFLSQQMLADTSDYVIHPGVLDACFQVTIALNFTEPGDPSGNIKLPIGAQSISVFREVEPQMKVYIQVILRTEVETLCNISLYSTEGERIANISGLRSYKVGVSDSTLSIPIIDSWLYGLDWIEKNIESTADNNNLEDGERWLVLTDSTGEACRFLDYCKKKLVDYTEMKFSELLSDATSEECYYKATNGGSFQKIISFGSLDLPKNEDITLRGIRTSGDYAQALMNLIKIIVKEDSRPKLWFVTKGSQQVNGGNASILQAYNWALARLIGSREHVSLWGGIIDLDPASNDHAKLLYNELALNDGEDQVSYAADLRYVARVNQLRNISKPFPVQLDDEAWYVVTGAFGSLGQLVCRSLREKGARNLILLARGTLPPREQWHEGTFEPNIKERVEFILDLERLGCNIKLELFDLTDTEELTRRLSAIKETGFSIKGVISTVGVVDDKLITEMSRETFEKVYYAKTLPHWTLHQIFGDVELDFFIMFSSIAALITAPGQANYASGNAFLDALSLYRRQIGLPSLSIAWGPWNAGMVKKLNLEQVYINKGIRPITEASGMQVMHRLIGQNIGYAAVLEADWDRVIDSAPRSKTPYLGHLQSQQRASEANNLTDAENQQLLYNKLIAAEESKRFDVVAEELIILIAYSFRMKQEDVSLQVALAELGMDSMLAMEIKNRIELVFGVEITIIDLLGNDSIERLVGKIYDLLKQLLELQTEEELLAEITDEEFLKILAEIEGLTDDESLLV